MEQSWTSCLIYLHHIVGKVRQKTNACFIDISKFREQVLKRVTQGTFL